MQLYPDLFSNSSYVNTPVSTPPNSANIRIDERQDSPIRQVTDSRESAEPDGPVDLVDVIEKHGVQFARAAPYPGVSDVELSERWDSTVWRRRFALGMVPVSVVGFGMGIWGLQDKCHEWMVDRQTGQKEGVTEAAVQCVVNSVVTTVSFLGAVFSGVTFLAELKDIIRLRYGSDKRSLDTWRSSVANHTALKQLSGSLGVPVSYLGEHYYRWPLEDTQSDEPTHHSGIFSIEHPKGAIHLAPMSNSSNGEIVWKVRFGNGRTPHGLNSTAPQRRNPDRYRHFANQAFSDGAGILVKGLSNPDGSPQDNPSNLNLDDTWDDFYQQINCYLQYSGMNNPTGLSFDVYDSAAKTTAWAGTMVFYGGPGTGSTSMDYARITSGIEPNPYCVNYNT